MNFYKRNPNVSVLATREYVKRIVSALCALADGAVCIGGVCAVYRGVVLLKSSHPGEHL
jgi:uncharacterized protein YjeT (DUF2065 family)